MASQATSTDETSWIEQGRNGSQRAFHKLYEANVDRLYRFMKQFSKSDMEVEDWVQRAFIKAFNGLQQFRGNAKFSSWLFRIALNEMQSDRRRMNPVEAVGTLDETAKDSTSAHDDFEWNATMKTYLDGLDETKRMVFILYEVEGYSHLEIASMLGVGESTSRTILSRTKQLLKQQWNSERRLQ